MAIGGDPDDLRSHASVLRGWADSVDDEADRLRVGERVEWESTAGDSFRHLLDTDIRQVGDVSGHLRDAATNLDRLADTLGERQQWLEAAKEKIEAGIDTAEGVVEDGAKKIWDGAGNVVSGLKGLL